MNNHLFLMPFKQKIGLILLSWLLLSTACYWFLLKPQQASLQQREKKNQQLLTTINQHFSQQKHALNKDKTVLLSPDKLMPFISSCAAKNNLAIKQFKPNAESNTLTLIGSYFLFTKFLNALSSYSTQIKITRLQLKRDDNQLKTTLSYLLSQPDQQEQTQ